MIFMTRPLRALGHVMTEFGEGPCELVRAVGTEQAPRLEAFQSLVDPDRGCGERASDAHAVLRLGLYGGQAAARALELECVQLPLMKNQQIGNARSDAESLQDCS